MFPQVDITQLAVAPSLHWTESFAAWLHENDKRPNTISAYLQDVRHFGQFFEGENHQAFEPSLLNATDVKKYFRWQDADKECAPRSRNRRLASLRVLVNWAAEIEVLDYDPTISIKRQPVEPSPRDRSGEEMNKLNAVLGSGSHLRCQSDGHLWLGLRDHAIWLLFNHAGLRISEVVGLDVSDLDFSSNEINVLGKGAKKASVKVSTEAMGELSEWLRMRGVNSKAVITDQDGNRISRGQAWRRVKLIGAAAGVGDLKPHDLRHTYAYSLEAALKQQGVPESARRNAVRKQMRHGDAKTTDLYFGVRDSQVRAAVEALG